MDWDEAYQCGYDAGVAASKLRVWTEMPDVEGWCWYMGTIRGQFGMTETDVPTIVLIMDYGDYQTMWESDMETKRDEAHGEWRGPIPNPFEEEA